MNRWRYFIRLPFLIMSLVLLYPLAAGSYSLYVMSLALVFGMLALSVDLLWGYAGILNLGPAVAFGLGGYAYAILMKGMGGGLLVTLLALLVAIVVPLAITLLISYAGFKSKTTLMYYALINLALALTLEQVAVVMIRYTGGSSGLINFPYPKIGIGPFSVVIFSSIQIYYFVAVTALAAYFLCIRFVNSPMGWVIRGIRMNEAKVESLGYNPLVYKMIISGFSAIIGGLAGAFFAVVSGIVHPQLFSVLICMQIFVWVAVGGQGSLTGPFLAAIAIKLIESYLSGVFVSSYLLILGLLFVTVVLVFPAGIAGFVPHLQDSLRRRFPGTTQRQCDTAGGGE